MLEQLQPFCLPGSPTIARPFCWDGITYATNRRVIVRVTLQSDVIDEAPKKAGVDACFDVEASSEGIPIPSIPTVGGPCDNCEARGYVECNMGHEHPCECCTDGRIGGILNVKIGPATFDAYYLKLISALPNVVFFPVHADKGCKFTFDGGDGVIMPVKVNK